MTTRTWTTFRYDSLTAPGDWSGPGTIAQGDTLVMRQGSGYLTNIAFTPYHLYLGSTVGEPVSLFMTNSSATVDVGGYGATDGNSIFGNRQSEIMAGGHTSLSLVGSAQPGRATMNVLVQGNGVLTASQQIGSPTTLRISGAQGQFINTGASLFNVNETVGSFTTGVGTWSLAGNDRLEFVGGVGSGQSVSLMANSVLQVDDAADFHAKVTLANGFNGQLLINEAHIDRATFAADMLTLKAPGLRDAVIGLHSSAAGFEVFGTPTGAMVVAGTTMHTPAGDTLLLRHIG